jgi:transglutaminase-like putative cysteine protease
LHSDVELREASRTSGCRMLELRRTPDGEWTGKVECPSNGHAYRFFLAICSIDLGDPVARGIGLEVHRRFAPDELRMARAIHAWVKEHIWYAREPCETFQSPSYTCRVAVGDCDDHANLVHAIARNAGLSARIAPLYRGRDVRHVVCQIRVEGRWCYAETTVDAEFDEEPRAAAARTRSQRKDIA